MKGPIYAKRKISGTKKRTHHTYSPRKSSIFKISSIKIKEKRNKKSINKNKKKISRPITIPEGRLTEPKKRFLFRRIMLQMKYNSGDFDYIEDDYDDLTREDMKYYKTSKDRDDREFYKEVQSYEDATDDVTVRRGWLAFKISLATIMLCTSIGFIHHTVQDIYASAPKEPVVITLQEATSEQISSAKNEINSLKINSEYDFENLTYQEQIDAALRIPIIESKINEQTFKSAIFNFKDQELLDEIIQKSFSEEEYNSYSDDKKYDLRKLAYELLEDNKKEYARDPEVLKELAEKQRIEKEEREARQAEVDERLKTISQNNNEEDIELE